MSQSGVERAPAYWAQPHASETPRFIESQLAVDKLWVYHGWLRGTLKVGREDAYSAGPDDLAARREALAESRQESCIQDRHAIQIGQLLACKVDQLEQEFRKQDVLDVGCGNGVFGLQLVRNAKAKVTFIDNDPAVFFSMPRAARRKVVGDGYSLPFMEGSFGKTIASFSTVTWAETPVQAVRALHEGLRVTRTGGTFFVSPLLTNVDARPECIRDHQRNIDRYGGSDHDRAHIGNQKVWATQDYALLTSVFDLIERGFCEATWSHYYGASMASGDSLEHYSAIIDKAQSIPEEVVDQHLQLAAGFMV